MVSLVRQFGPRLLPPGTPQEPVKILRQAMTKVFKIRRSTKIIRKSSAKNRPLLEEMESDERYAARCEDGRTFQETERGRSAAAAVTHEGTESFLRRLKPFKSLDGT